MSTKSSKGVRGIVKGCLRICRRASAKSQSSKASAESYCIPRIVEGQSACSSRKGGVIVAVLYVAVDRQNSAQRVYTYVCTYLRRSRGQAYGVCLCCYVSVIKPLLLLAASVKLVRHIRIQ